MEERKEKKKALRKACKEQWKNLSSDYIATASKQICDTIRTLPEYQKAKRVFCFVSMDRELDTHSLLEAILDDSKELIVPRVLSMGKMALHRIDRLDDLEKSKLGIPEPAADAPTVTPDDVDLTIVPCLTTTLDGARMGRGGGFYDRFLAVYRGDTALVCFHRLTVPEVPMDPWDVHLPLVVTEEGVYRA